IAGVRTFTNVEEGEARVVGGREAWPHSWPWQVLLTFANIPACGGAVLDQYWIVSAAHCFRRYSQESYWAAKVGKHDLTNDTESCQQTAKVAKIITHVNYNSVTKENDIALLKLQTPLMFDECVRPIPVWSGDSALVNKCTVTGWGFTSESGPRADRLQEANVTILDSNSCIKLYGGLIYSSMVCAGEMAGGVDACQGDSGGPLSCFTGTRYEVAGLVSWGVGCARALKPGVYTRVTLYIQWINSTMDVKNCGKAEVEPCKLDHGYVGLKSSASGEMRLVNVTEACPHSWPWQVSLQSEGTHYCSGTLIDERWVLTARHCRAEAGDMVALGAHDLDSMEIQQVPIKEVYSQPYDGSFPPLHDLALIYLSVPAPLGSSVNPACIQDEDLTFDQSSFCVTTGWGYKRLSDLSPDILYQARVSPLPEQACWSGWGQVFSSTVLLCTQPAASSSCLGDAGAPLLCQKNGQYYLAGMMALGLKRCDQMKPAIFTSLSSFQSWITDIMENEGQ
ncbi:ovochymase-1 precursor, partial [Silurus meridionalis]